MLRTYTILMLCLLGTALGYSANMGTCRMTCENSNGVTSWPTTAPTLRQGKRGSPGSKGEKGSRGMAGPKGDAASPCNCPEQGHLQSQLDTLKAQLKSSYAPSDCREVFVRREGDIGGVYDIYPSTANSDEIKVYCDTKTDSGGWIVFQRRMDGSEDFYRNWEDYVNGFGNLHGEFWLGLDKIYQLMKEGQYELRVDMEDFENNKAYAKYSTFKVGGPETFFALTTSGYSGNAGNSLQLSGIAFSTKDQDHDTDSGSCSDQYKGAMWYTNCHAANPNGLYLKGNHGSFANGVNWKDFKGYNYSLKFIEMKMRIKN